MINLQSATRNPKSILIVDDDPDDIAITIRTLCRECRGLILKTTQCGDDALALLRSEESLPSLVLLDLKMPGMDGIDALKIIRTDPRLKNLPVVIVTNSTLDADRNAALDAGADAFLHKAFNINVFAADMRRLLERWVKE